MVAPSYQKYKQVSEPYQKNGKTYIKIEHPTTHNVREARYYTESEYNKLYNGKATKVAVDANPSGMAPATGMFGERLKSLKEVLGFTKGYITIFKGDTDSLEEAYFYPYKEFRFHNLWGWYVISTEEIPAPLPAGIEPIQLKWEDVSVGEHNLKSTTAIREHLDSLLYEPSVSQHVGSVGERIPLTLTLLKDITVDGGQYGPKHLYIFQDMNLNIYSWLTQAKVLRPGVTYDLKGTIAAHETYRGERQTKLQRCTILS